MSQGKKRGWSNKIVAAFGRKNCERNCKDLLWNIGMFHLRFRIILMSNLLGSIFYVTEIHFFGWPHILLIWVTFLGKDPDSATFHVTLDANLSLVGSHFCHLSGYIVLIVRHLSAGVIPFLSLFMAVKFFSYLWDYIFITCFRLFHLPPPPHMEMKGKCQPKEIVQNIVSGYSLCFLHLQSTDLSLSNLS